MRGFCLWCDRSCERDDPYCSVVCEIAHENHKERQEAEEIERLAWLDTLAPDTKTLVNNIKGRATADALEGRIKRSRDYRAKLFAAGLAERRDGHGAATGRATRAPGA